MELPDKNKNERLETGDYAYKAGIDAVNSQANEYGGILQFIQLCGQNIAAEKREQLERLSTLSGYIADVYGDPTDSDDQRAIKSAFLKGIVTGVCVADQAYGEVADIDDIVDYIEIDRPYFDTVSEFFVNRGRLIIEMGRQANDLMGECEETISEWEAKCVTDLRYHRYYRMGFGIFMGSANQLTYKIWHEHELEQMGEELSTIEGYDWDQALRLLDDKGTAEGSI